MIVKMALEMILLAVSHTPMGLTPGHLSRAISLQASRAEMPLGSIYVVQSLLVRSAREWQRSCDADLKEVHNLLQQCASKPEGPAEPFVARAEERIVLASMLSNITG